MKKFAILMRRLSVVRESINKIIITLIKNIHREKMNDVPKKMIDEMLAVVKQIKKDISELELILMVRKKKK